MFKPRTPFGYFLDKNGIKQDYFMERSGLNRETVSRLCNSKDAFHVETKRKAVGTLRRMGFDVEFADFWE
jgi:hypothetical protein